MNRLFLLFFLSVQTLFGSIILSYNIYDRTDRVDIMFTFDTPYEGKILKQQKENKIILKLYGASIESTKQKRLQSPFLSFIAITPFQDYTQITATIPNKNITLKASKTADAYGLRLRFLKKSTISKTSTTSLLGTKKSPTASPSTLPTQKSLEIPTSYYVVVGILLLLVIVLYLMKNKIKKLQPTQEEKKNGNWLFANLPKEQQATATPQTSTPTEKTQEGVSIRFQKQLNENSSVVLLDFLNQSYLILLGTNNNILLDKFIDDKPLTQNEFEALLDQQYEKLERYLEEPVAPVHNNISDFSKKASHIPLDNL